MGQINTVDSDLIQTWYMHGSSSGLVEYISVETFNDYAPEQGIHIRLKLILPPFDPDKDFSRIPKEFIIYGRSSFDYPLIPFGDASIYQEQVSLLISYIEMLEIPKLEITSEAINSGSGYRITLNDRLAFISIVKNSGTSIWVEELSRSVFSELNPEINFECNKEMEVVLIKALVKYLIGCSLLDEDELRSMFSFLLSKNRISLELLRELRISERFIRSLENPDEWSLK